MQDQDDQLPPKEFFTEFELGDAWSEVKNEFQTGTVKSKAASSAKLIGKSLWNLGLNIAKNLPEHLEKAAASAEKQNNERDRRKALFDRKSNQELYDIAKSNGNDSDRRIAYEILRARKAEHDALKNEL